MNNEPQNIIVDLEDAGTRLDKFLTTKIPLSRSRIQNLINDGQVQKSGLNIVDCKYAVKQGDIFNVTIPAPEPSELLPSNIPLDIVYEDEYLIVINKQSNLTVHPGAGNRTNTMANALIYHFKNNLSGIGGAERPGIVHRLDKETSGLMIVAKTDYSHTKLARMIADHDVKRHYLALCWGVPVPAIGTINAAIGRHIKERTKMSVTNKHARKAITHYMVKKTYPIPKGFQEFRKESLGEAAQRTTPYVSKADPYSPNSYDETRSQTPHSGNLKGEGYNNVASLVECRLETGRTHQIRVHFAHIKNPIIGDKTYDTTPNKKNLHLLEPELQNNLKNFPRQALHSYYLAFTHPITEKELEFSCPPPEDMQNIINQLESIKT